MNKITDVTREEIFNMIRTGFNITYQIEKIDLYEKVYFVDGERNVQVPYHGKLDFIKFWGRVYKLDELPSTDSRYNCAEGDISQHTINNDDWEWDFFIEYPPFELDNGSDEILLTFLSEMFHPAVRDEKTHWEEFLNQINNLLQYDGYEITATGKISGRDLYSYRKLFNDTYHIEESLKEIEQAFSSDYMDRQIESMLKSVRDNPSDAIGKAKELFESCCKTILDNEGIKIEKNWDLQRLTKETTKLLKLTPHDIDDEKKASGTIKQILGSLSAISNGMDELRNSYGTGHGKTSNFRGLSHRHANLAVGSSVTAVRFSWDTYNENKE